MPVGVAVLVDVLTDNKNRTVAEIRHLFAKHGGTWETGCCRVDVCPQGFHWR